MPILVGSLQTLLGLLLVFGLVIPLAGAGIGGAALCLGVLFVAPFGILPALVALRRDAKLSAAQGFAVAFIAVGFGTFLWAAPAIAEAGEPDLRTVRKALVDMQAQLPEDQRMSAELVDDLARTIVDLAPYVPAIIASFVTLLAGFVGMLAVHLRLRRRRLAVEAAAMSSPDDPSPDEPPR
ncbi:MAG: hypothetical protein IT457_10625 [Planctomycetes bacterium]|nr:hypothetical protein [Planctomycetota bacterium]